MTVGGVPGGGIFGWPGGGNGSGGGGGGRSIYDRCGAACRNGDARDTQGYRDWNTAYRQASDDNWYLSIPVLAPYAVVIGLEAGGAAALRGACNCFVEGTLVQTDQGAKPIDQVIVGDLVLARDEITDETAYKPVVALIAGAERQIWEVTVETFDAEGTRRETIGTTDEHPWRLVGGEWSETAELEPGNELVTADGRRAVVVSATQTQRFERTYNFEVEEFHTYFVGEGGLWVHNVCDPSKRAAQLLRNKQFRTWFHRVFKPSQKIGGGRDARNPDMSADDVIEAFEEWVTSGRPIL